MRMTIFGASGRSGRKLVERALEAGHEVTAFVRDPDKLPLSHDKLLYVQGDIHDQAAVEEAVRGAEVVFSTIGAVKGEDPNVMAPAGRNITAAMEKQGARRLVFLTGAGVVQPQDPPTFASRVIVPLMKLVAGGILKDAEAGVEAVKNSNLEWVVIRAPRLGDVPPTGEYRTGYIKTNFKELSRDDLAEFMLRQAGSDEYVRELPIICY